MRLAGYSLEDICRTTMTPNERPMLERVDGRNDIYWLEADFRYADIRTVGGTVAKPEWLSVRQSLPPYRARVGNCRSAHRLVPLIRVPRRAFGNGGGPSPLETGTAPRSGFWLHISWPSDGGPVAPARRGRFIRNSAASAPYWCNGKALKPLTLVNSAWNLPPANGKRRHVRAGKAHLDPGRRVLSR